MDRYFQNKERVLLVEDSRTFAGFMEGFLSNEGATVKVVRSLVEAREELSLGGYRLVILDHILSDGYGITLIPQFARSVPIVLCSGVGDMCLASEAMRKGAAGCCDKQNPTWMDAEIKHAIQWWDGNRRREERQSRQSNLR